MARKSRLFVVVSCTRRVDRGRARGAECSGPTAQQGVTDKEYDIVVLVADLDGLRAQGVSLPEKLTTGNLGERWQVFFDSYGKVNGKTFNVIPVTWDPIDPTSFEDTCIKATQDNQPFAVMNANGYRQSSVGCITVDNDTFMFFGEGGYGELVRGVGQEPRDARRCPVRWRPRPRCRSPTSRSSSRRRRRSASSRRTSPASRPQATPPRRSWRRPASTWSRRSRSTPSARTLPAAQRDAAASVATFQAAGADSIVVLVQLRHEPGVLRRGAEVGCGVRVHARRRSQLAVHAVRRQPHPDWSSPTQAVPCVTTWGTRAVTHQGRREGRQRVRGEVPRGVRRRLQPDQPARRARR